MGRKAGAHQCFIASACDLLTAAEPEGTSVAVHGEVHQPHWAVRSDGQSNAGGTHTRRKDEPTCVTGGSTVPVDSPHGVEHSPVLHDAEQFVGRGHVMGDGLLGVPEEGVWYPDLVHHAVVQPEDFRGAFKLQPLVNPHLTEEHVHGVLLTQNHGGFI